MVPKHHIIPIGFGIVILFHPRNVGLRAYPACFSSWPASLENLFQRILSIHRVFLSLKIVHFQLRTSNVFPNFSVPCLVVPHLSLGIPYSLGPNRAAGKNDQSDCQLEVTCWIIWGWKFVNIINFTRAPYVFNVNFNICCFSMDAVSTSWITTPS